MQIDTLEHLLNKAKKEEKRYAWLQALELYKKASELALEVRDFLIAAEHQEQMGFCFYRAAFQAKTNIEYKRLMKRAIQAYEKEIEILEETKEEKHQRRITHAHALVAHVKSMLETTVSKKNELADNWWRLEKQALEAYETSGDLDSVGRVCNNLTEWNIYDRFFLVKNSLELEKRFEESTYLAEKSIQTLSKLNNKYELARAYCFAGWYYGMSHTVFNSEDKILQSAKKCQDYANRALELSREIGDAWLIGRSYHSALNAPQNLNANPVSAKELSEKMLKYGKIAKDNYVIAYAESFTSHSNRQLAYQLEDPDKQREGLRKAMELARESKQYFQRINQFTGFVLSYSVHIIALQQLASIETDQKTKQDLIEMAGKVIQEGMKNVPNWIWLGNAFYALLSSNLSLLSETKTDPVEKRKLLQKALLYYEKYLRAQKVIKQLMAPEHFVYSLLAFRQYNLANLEKDYDEKIRLLKKAAASIEKSIELAEKSKKLLQTPWASRAYFGNYYYSLGRILQQIYYLTKEEKACSRAIEAHKNAAIAFTKGESPAHAAESYWHIAQLEGQAGANQKASQNYESASQAYDVASKKMPQLKEFYKDYSLYMQAWSQLEQARLNHSIEEYSKARQNYERAAKLHESTNQWSYLAPNYFAWASMEEAEGLSRSENTGQAKVTFQKALEQFAKAEKTIKERIGEITSAEEKEMTQRLLQASNLRRKYCQARILVEDAKLMEREGRYMQSSKSYGEAAKNISAIVEGIDVEAERKEFEYLAILCRAWEKMAVAEERPSSESYLEAAEFFERAKDYCYTRRASLWAVGNSSFCKGLAAGTRYQDSLDLKETVMAKRYMNSAATMYQQAGFENASEYAKATQRLFDAYIFMNKGESEANPEKRAKQYQMAENVLQMAAGSFLKAKQPEKRAQVRQILTTVREEKTLAISLTDVMHAPIVTSTTSSFTAPTPTSEVSVGLESFEHANVQANLVVGLKEVRVGESFCLSVEFVNAGKEPALLTRVEDFVPPGFVVVEKPEIYRLEGSCLNMKGKQIAPLKLVEAKVVLQPSKKGLYQLNPKVHYLDENGQNKWLQLKSMEIKVEEVVLPDRVSTGTKELDSLLFGGLPEEYAVVLTGSPSDERAYLIRNFLGAGIAEDEIVFYVATEAANVVEFLENPNFHLFLCNPKPKTKVPDLPNVNVIRSKTDLTNLGISLVKAYRNIEPLRKKRVCIEIVSNVLLNYEAKATCKWISELTTDLSSKGFTILAVMDPNMHPPDQANAVINSFDGEINITQTEDPQECKKSIRVKKLRNQDYIKNPICLTANGKETKP